MKIFFVCLAFSLPFFGLAQNRIILDSLTIILENVFDEDQKLRFVLDSLQTKFGNNSSTVNSYWQKINKQDSIHKKCVTEIIDKFGWLSADETSVKANTSLFLIIQHADVATQIKYLPKLKKAINEGKAEKQSYAYLLDRSKMLKDKYQIYGTQIGGDYKGNLIIWPIKDEPNVNERRKSIGLDSIQEYARKSGVTYLAASIDSLKNKIIVNGYIYEVNQRPLDSVEVCTGYGKFMTQTDRDGVFRVIVNRSVLKSKLIFKKNGFQNGVFFFDKKDKDVFFIDILLLRGK